MNATAYDRWYFDAVSSIAVIFHNRGPRGFLGPNDLGSIVNVQMLGTFPTARSLTPVPRPRRRRRHLCRSGIQWRLPGPCQHDLGGSVGMRPST